MPTYNYKYTDDYEKASGKVDALDAEAEAEFVEVSRLKEYFLDIRMDGTRKRSPIRIVA